MQTMDDGGEAEIKVNEFQLVQGAANGSRMPGPAGIRIGNEKYVFVRHDQEYQSTYMTKQGGGGGCVARFKGGLVIGLWDNDQKIQPGGNQNAADCGMMVEDMATMLKDAGY